MSAPAETPDHKPTSKGGALVTLIGNTYLVVATLVLSTLALLLSWLPFRRTLIFRLSRLWSHGLLKICRIRLHVSSEAELDRSETYVFMVNHLSLFDIPTLLASTPVQCRFMAKRSLFKIPIFGWVLRVGGYVSVDRNSREGPRASFNRALEELRTGASLVVFPEGTRSLEGGLLPFKRGGLLLALRCGLPIVPVGIRGTRELRVRKSFAINPGEAEVRYGRPIDLKGYGVRDVDRLSDELRARIAELAGLG